MVSVDKLSVHFGGFVLFNEISFMINPRDRIGLVGKNGAGKSTLMKILHGVQEPSNGNVVKPEGYTTGYLPQQMEHSSHETIRVEVQKAFKELNSLQAKIDDVNQQLADRDDYQSDKYLSLINSLAEMNEQLQIRGAGSATANVEQTLMGLGFETADFDRPCNEFSGGWRTRVELAKILLQNPAILLLDEPTNHLDIESIQWLENFLIDYPGAVILISHDRAFLDNVTKRTIELSLGKITDYQVPYSKYVVLREERREQQLAAYRNQQKQIEDTEEFIERFRYKATKAVQVQARIKQLEKMDRVEVEEEDVREMKVQFPPAPRSGSIVVETEGLSKSYGGHLVLDSIDLVVERGEKIAFVGRNGEGKTTLSRIIMGDLDYTGKLKIGSNVNIGYFAQNQDEMLDVEKTVLQTIDDIAVGDVRTKIRDILGAFLFSGEDVDKKVKVLSGGERSRLTLATLLLKPYNLLVLDEPTNHLDMVSKDILKDALLNYNGTLVIVSHDRYFLDGLTDKIYEFRNKKIKENSGGIYNFLQKKKLHSLNELEKKDQAKSKPRQASRSENKASYLDKKELEKEIRKATNKVQKCEGQIELYEKEIEEIDKVMADPGSLQNAGDDIYDKYNLVKEKLEKELERWELLQVEQENLMDKRNEL